MNKEICIVSIFVLTVVLVSIIGAISIYNHNFTIKQDDFCKSYGYNKSTDFKVEDRMFQPDYIQVECDNKHILTGEINYICSKFDKWGDCIKKESIIG